MTRWKEQSEVDSNLIEALIQQLRDSRSDPVERVASRKSKEMASREKAILKGISTHVSQLLGDIVTGQFSGNFFDEGDELDLMSVGVKDLVIDLLPDSYDFVFW